MVVFQEKLLITGGLGYVGGRIATHLQESDPNMSLRIMTRPTRSTIPDWAKSIEIVTADIFDTTSIAKALDGVDVVVHLAAVNEIESQNNPDLAVRINGQGTHAILEGCRQAGVGKFIYFSTFHVYGPSAPELITEETPARPTHPYSITHHLAEDFTNWYRESHEIDTLILRLSNGYGYPADSFVNRWTLVFNDLCSQAIRNQEITLRSSGTQLRDFISLSDVARGVQHFLSGPTARWEDGLFNLGGDHSMSILDVAKTIASEYWKCYNVELPVNVPVANSTEDTITPLSFSIEKLKKSGFSLTGDMSQEIRRTFQLCENMAASEKNQ